MNCTFLGPIAGVVLRRLSCRSVTVIGTLLLTAGFVTSMFVESLGMLYITVGIVGGKLTIDKYFIIYFINHIRAYNFYFSHTCTSHISVFCVVSHI